MENNEVMINKELEEKEPLNETQENDILTNEQKLEYLSKLIQEVDKEIESSEVGRKLSK